MNPTLSQIAEYVGSQSWQVAVLVAVVGLVSHLLRNCSAHVRYLLWLLVLAKCLVPPVVGIALPVLPQGASPLSGYPPAPAWDGPVKTTVDEISAADITQMPGPSSHRTDSARASALDISPLEVMEIVWAAGAAVFTIAVIVKAGRMTQWLMRERQAPPASLWSNLQELLSPTNGARVPHVWLVEHIGQPFVWGLLRGEIYLPASFASMGSREHQRDVLAHEFCHVLRCDSAVNSLQVLSQALFWFHPLVWWANQRIRAEREKSCDEMAIARFDAQPREYSRAIVETLLNEHNSLRQVPSLAVAGPVKNIEERIKTMLHPGKKFHGGPSLLAATCVMLLGLLIVPTTLALTPRRTVADSAQAQTRLDGYGIKLPESRLEVLDVRFEPIHQGKNVVHVTVRNTSDKEQVFATHIYTRSPDYGVDGVGWGTGFFETIGPREDKSVRFVFKIQGPITNRTYVNLSFHNPETRESYDSKRYFEERRYTSDQLAQAQPDAVMRKPSPTDEAQAVTQAFGQIQGLIQQARYEQAWQRFTEDFQNAEYQTRFEWFRRAMEPTHPLHSAFTWEREDFLKLKPREVVRTDGVFALTATLDGQTWTIDFVRQDDLWKIDWIAGYTPKILDIQKQDKEPAIPQVGNNAATGNLKVLDIELDPIQSGRNAVRFQVQNTSQTDQIFGLDIRTESRDGNSQRQFTKHLKAGQTESMQFDFEIAGSLADTSLLRLRFCNPPSTAALDINNWFEQHTYTAEKLGRHDVNYAERQVAQESLPIPQTSNNVKVLDIRFDPIRQGKNVVRVQIQNTSRTEQTLGLDIRTEFPIQSWQRQLFERVQGGETKLMAFEFEVLGPIMDDSSVRLRFYNPPSADAFDLNNWFAERRYPATELPLQEGARGPAGPVSQAEKEAVTKTFVEFQRSVNERDCPAAWNVLSEHMRSMFKNDIEKLRTEMGSDDARERFGDLRPGSVTRLGTFLTLSTQGKLNAMKFHFVQEGGQWKLYEGQPDTDNWEDRVLPTMEKRVVRHSDIYYFRDSTAAREIDQIAKDKDKGFDEICRFLGKDSDVRIRIVFFEDGKTKQQATGHQGAGWAYGNTIVEIYNEKERLDPYHETTHILMGPLGSPPALFNEGFATYMSEKLGAPALENLGGGKATIHRRAKELKDKGDWIALPELLGYTEIGSAKSRPPVAYPEAGSFVQFLIETYGKDKFLQAYRTLKNSDQQAMRDENVQSLARIYGQSLDSLERQWHDVISQAK